MRMRGRQERRSLAAWLGLIRERLFAPKGSKPCFEIRAQKLDLLCGASRQFCEFRALPH